MKPLFFVVSSQKEMRSLPDAVQSDFGYGLYLAQCGEKAPEAKPLKGFGGAGVLEIISRREGDTFRAVYTVNFPEAVYVLYVFQKKSKSGIATPKQEIDLIKSRLKVAEQDYIQWQANLKKDK